MTEYKTTSSSELNTLLQFQNDSSNSKCYESRDDALEFENVLYRSNSSHDIIDDDSNGNGLLSQRIKNYETPPTWEIEKNTVMTIPLYYPLEKSHITVHDVAPSLIAERIAQCLRALSISALFDNWQATATAKTSNHVHFTIRLFKQASANKNVIIELQRTKGDLLTFHRTSTTIFQAANGATLSARHPPCHRPDTHVPSTSVQNDNDEDDDDDALLLVETINMLLKKDRVDAQLLGIESLRYLTDSSITRKPIVLRAAHIVLGGVSPVTKAFESLLIDPVSDNLYQYDYNALRNHALAVLANALAVLAQEGTLEALLRDRAWLTGEGLLKALIWNLDRSEVEPHDAYLAAKAMNLLIGGSGEAHVRAVGLGLVRAMKGCYYVGLKGHENLAKESELVLKVLSETVL